MERLSLIVNSSQLRFGHVQQSVVFIYLLPSGISHSANCTKDDHFDSQAASFEPTINL